MLTHYVLMDHQQLTTFQKMEIQKRFYLHSKEEDGALELTVSVKPLMIASQGLKMVQEAQKVTLIKSNSMMVSFLQMIKITSKIGPEFFSNIVMVLDIKEPRRILSLTRELIFISGVIMRQQENSIVYKNITNCSHKLLMLLSQGRQLVDLQFSYGQTTSKKE